MPDRMGDRYFLFFSKGGHRKIELNQQIVVSPMKD